MLGKTPGRVQAIRPLKDGVIADFRITEILLTHFINATVDDNRVSEMTTYSSKKIEDRFVNLEEKVNGGLSNIATSVNELITYC